MEIQPKGFLHNKLDVKVLILFILARIDTPLTAEEIYEIAYQDESLRPSPGQRPTAVFYHGKRPKTGLRRGGFPCGPCGSKGI